jgi:DNA-binding response OmpR family regulator
MKLLLVEDDPEICGMLKKFLEKENFEIITANDGEEACSKFRQETCDLVLLDLMLPKISGMDVLQQIRAQSTVPIIIMSAKDTDSDITLGFGLGADDYVTKPFSMVQVLARIKANLRRTGQYAASSPARPSLLTVGELRMNLEDYTVSKQGKEIELTAKEFEILRLLLQNPRKVYTKEQIYSLIWNDAYLGDENAVNVHISRLRNKIEDNPRSPKYVITVWGIGYKSGEFK